MSETQGNFSVIKVQDQNSFVKKYEIYYSVFQRNFHFKAINHFPRLIIFLKRDKDKSQLSTKVAKAKCLIFQLLPHMPSFAFS